MGNPPAKLPLYRRQKRQYGDLAFVLLDGKRIYLGSYDSPESRAEYNRHIKEWQANGQRLPVGADDLTIVELCAQHRNDFEKSNPGAAKEQAAYATVVSAMVKHYKALPVAKFGPLQYKAVRQELMDTPDARFKDPERKRSRKYINKLTDHLKHILNWGVAEGILPPAVTDAIEKVPNLKRGRTTLPETKRVQPVADSVIDATSEYLTKPLAAMVRLQQYTGMRPGEVCIMRSTDIDTSGKIWTYQPQEHKTSHIEKSRTVYLGPKAQAILKPFLRKELEAFIFSPQQSEQERLERRRENRKTPEGQGNEPGTNRKRRPKKAPGVCYTTPTYARAIEYACHAAFGKNFEAMRWSPNQLRHSFATNVRKTYGLEASQVLLGHATADVTQIYAERDTAKAVKVIARIG